MNKHSPFRAMIFLMIILAVLLAPLGFAQAAEGNTVPTLVRLTISNKSQHTFTLLIDGPAQYDISVPGYTTMFWTVKRGTYDMVLKACNHSSSGTLDMTKFQIMHVPPCGGSAGAIGNHPHNIDVADYIKMVRVTIRNKTKESIGVYLRTLDRHYFLNFKPKEVQTLMVPRNTYVFSYVACGELQVGYYPARGRIPLELDC